MARTVIAWKGKVAHISDEEISDSGTIKTRCGRTLKSFNFFAHIGKECRICGMPHDFRRVRKVVKEQL